MRWRPRRLWTLSPVLLTIGIAVVGKVFERDWSRDVDEFGVVLVWTLLLLHLPLAVILWFRLREARWGAVIASAVFAACSLGAAFVSMIAITGIGP